MLRPTTVYVIRVMLIVLFTYAALSKLLDYNTFKFQLGRSPYVTNISGFVAWVLPVGEILIALLLIFNRTIQLGLYASFFLMFLFTGYIYAMLHYSYYLPCSCGGILSKMSWKTHLIFNIVFTLLTLIGIVLMRKTKHYEASYS